nr:C39 family peptidase [Bacillus sp. EB106-08-02-XG196]
MADVGTRGNMDEVATPFTKVVLSEEIQLDVPLLNQMDEPRLFNGCEVTSLAMLLQYWGIDVSKNQLAAQVPRVPLQYRDGKNGNPNMGFVGNMEDGPGLGVYHGPIFYLANTNVTDQFVVQNLSNYPFSTILEKINQGLPVWVITTSSFSPIVDFETWTTPQGTVGITFKMHSVVITGYDQEYIYLNDPYGTKNKKVDRENFIASWEQMGSQAIVIEPK